MNTQAMLEVTKESNTGHVNEKLAENTDKNNNQIGESNTEETSLFPSIEIPATILPWKKQNGSLPVIKKFKRRKGNLDELLPKVEAKKWREQNLQTNIGDTLSSSQPLRITHDHHSAYTVYSPSKKQILHTDCDERSSVSSPYTHSIVPASSSYISSSYETTKDNKMQTELTSAMTRVTESDADRHISSMTRVTESDADRHINSMTRVTESEADRHINSMTRVTESHADRQINVEQKNSTKSKDFSVLKNKQQNQSKQQMESKTNKRTLSANERYSKLTSSQLQRRLIANARERSRVHALSNAFNSLRCAIPSYSTEQRLSKLTILRVAINYINALENILEQDPECCATTAEFEKFVDECSSVLQTEYGRSKSKHGLE